MSTALGDGSDFGLSLPHEATITALQYLADGRLLAVASKMYGPFCGDRDSDLVQVWDVGRPALLSEWQVASPGRRWAAIEPQGAAVATTAGGELALWAIPGGRQIWRARPHSSANAIRFSPDGRFLATAGPYGPRDDLAVVELRRAVSGTLTFSASPGIASCDAIAFSPDGSRIAVAGIHEDPYLGSIFVWSTGGRALLNREHELGGRSHVEYTTDGRFLVFARQDVHFWDAVTGEPVRVIEPQPGEVFCDVFVHPDGQTLIAIVSPRSTFEPRDLGDEIVELFPKELNAFEVLIKREVAKRKAEPPGHSTIDVVRIDLTSGREVIRCRRVLANHPKENSAYFGRATTLSADGTKLAMARHTSVNVWDLGDELRDEIRAGNRR
jgi:WD40 repeat protein